MLCYVMLCYSATQMINGVNRLKCTVAIVALITTSFRHLVIAVDLENMHGSCQLLETFLRPIS